MHTDSRTHSSPPRLPLVLSVGFAGSRHLLDEVSDRSEDEVQRYEDQVTQYLQEVLEQLPGTLGLPEHEKLQHFFCSISQLAIGADQCFTRACQQLGIPQRLFLPLPWDAYSTDTGSDGTSDFSPAQKVAAAALVDSPHIIQQRIISHTDNRRARFEDVNLEIVSASDVIISLVRAEADAKPGGTKGLIDLAIKRGKPVLEITVAYDNGNPVFNQQWQQPYKDEHGIWKSHAVSKLSAFQAPTLPHELEKIPLLAAQGKPLPVSAYAQALKQYGSSESAKHQRLFKYAALIIIGTHLLATVAAVIAMKDIGTAVKVILGIELVFLAFGFGVHQYLHRSHATLHWAFSRLAAELARSVLAIGRRHVYLGYLFDLPFPHSLRPVLRSLNTLHLHSTRPQPQDQWTDIRDEYIQTRLDDPVKGQLPFYSKKAQEAASQLKLAQRTFLFCSIGAFTVSLTKLLVKCHCMDFLPYTSTSTLCGALAVILPVLAVGALSLAAAFDLEARAHTFEDMRTFLLAQKQLLLSATSEKEYDKLLLETESRLLGETVNWFSRRSFTGVA